MNPLRTHRITRLFLAFLLATTVNPATADNGAVAWNPAIEVAKGPAYQGPWRMNESQFHYVDDPTVALSADGIAAVAWADNARQDIFFQRFSPDEQAQPGGPVNVSRSAGIFSWLPRLAISDDAEHVAILWQEIIFSGGSHGGEILFSRSTDGGKTFSPPINLSNTTAGAGKGRLTARSWHNGSLDLTSGPEGDLHAAWTEYEGALRFSRSTDGGASFSAPQRIAGDGQTPARGPTLAVDRKGRTYLAWTVGEDLSADIRLSISEDRGKTFSRPQVVHASPGHADAPKFAVDSRGTVHLVYGESASGPGGPYHIRYTRSRDGGNTFETPRAIAAPRSRQFTSFSFPALGLGGQDNLLVIWELFPDPRGRSLGIGYTHSRDRGETFAESSIIPGSADPSLGINGSLQGLLMNKLAVNQSGAIAAVNSRFKSHEISRIQLYRGKFTGDVAGQ